MQLEELNFISSKMLPKTQIKPADLLIVFGTTYGIDLFIENIVSLYQKGFCKYILCTGGNVASYNNKTATESVIIMDLLVENGVPADKIVIIDKVTYEDGIWQNGKIYDPTSGKTYKVEIRFSDAKTLEVKGKLGPFFKKVYWTKL